MREQWLQWVNSSTTKHLLLSCYILECQQGTVLARSREASLIRTSGENLPFPAHRSLWDARDPQGWLVCSQKHTLTPSYVFEALHAPIGRRYDPFQSSVLIAVYHNPLESSAAHLDGGIDDLVSLSPETQHQLFSAKLAQMIPARALIAVSGEGWILGTKVTLPLELEALKEKLRTWTTELWSGPTDYHSQSAFEELRISITILKLSFENDKLPSVEMGAEMGLVLAALVVWAATVAADTRLRLTALSSQHLHSALEAYGPDHSTPFASIPPAYLNRRSSVPLSEIASSTGRFLNSALDDISSSNSDFCHSGCTSLLLWVKMQLRDASLDGTSPENIGSSADVYGELIHSTARHIEGMLNHGWEGWGF